jgi:hypothetical protein
MNAWISSELDKIDKKSSIILNHYKILESRLSKIDFDNCCKPIMEKLLKCYQGNCNDNIHDIHLICFNNIENVNEILLDE